MEDTLFSLADELLLFMCKKKANAYNPMLIGLDYAGRQHFAKEIISKIKTHANFVSVAGLSNAVPGLAPAAIAGVIASTWKMYYDINKIIGISFSENFLKSVASGIVSNLASTGVAIGASNLLSWAFGVGTVISAFTGAAANRAAIYSAAAAYLKILVSLAKSDGAISEENFNYQLNSVCDTSSMSPIELKVKTLIVEKLGVDESEVTLEASIIDDLGADSLDAVELIMEVENEFGITIPDDQAEQIVTVGDAVAYVEANV